MRTLHYPGDPEIAEIAAGFQVDPSTFRERRFERNTPPTPSRPPAKYSRTRRSARMINYRQTGGEHAAISSPGILHRTCDDRLDDNARCLSLHLQGHPRFLLEAAMLRRPDPDVRRRAGRGRKHLWHHAEWRNGLQWTRNGL